MEENTVLIMSRIRKEFQGVIALSDVNFVLKKGEVHVLLGENGAGKSTLVKILSGAYQMTNGEIFLFNKQVYIKSPGQAQELGIGIIYQELNLIPYLTAAENIFLGREITNKFGIIDKKGAIESSKKILKELGSEINCDIPVINFGIAQQQMIEVAKALSLDAKILIMDEPTSALSDTEVKQLFKMIRNLKRRGVSIIYISHRLDELFEIGDRVTVLRDGVVVGTKDISETTKTELIKMMVNRELTEHFPKRNVLIGEEILRVENLSKKNGITNINFTLKQGEVLGIAGLLGSGRTELARAIFGIDKLDSGNIYLQRKLQKIKSPKDAINQRIGFITEDRKSQGLVLILSVKENISLTNLTSFSGFGFINSKEEKKEAEEFINRLKIKTSSLDQKVIYLSGGNQQKVVLAKWLSKKADIFIFDEPTRGIDVAGKVEIYNLINQLAEEGVGIIMISSELPEILGMSDRIIVMNNKKIAAGIPIKSASQELIMKYAIGA